MIAHSLASMTTRLPYTNVETSNQTAPQYNAVTWAFAMGRTITDLPITATLVLVAYAQHAEASTFNPNGYLYATLADIRNLTGLSESTVRTHTKSLVRKGLLNAESYVSGVRVPETAFNADWISAK